MMVINEDMMGKDLSEHKWNNRLVLLIANDTDNKDLQLQLEELKKDIPGLDDRKILIYKILPNKYQIESPDEADWVISSDLYNKYRQLDSPFEFILIGLDGGIKLSEEEPVSSKELFSIIDRMPMRAQELKNKN